MFCSNCGSEVVGTSKFCAECGTAVSDKEAPAVTSSVKTKRSLWISLPIIIVGLVLILVFVWGARPSKRAEAERDHEEFLREMATGESSSKPKSRAKPKARSLSAEELFKLASPGVVLIEVYDDSGHQTGLGSGFVVSKDGSVVTNYHVIRGASRAIVKHSDGASSPVTGVLAYDRGRDVAVIKFSGAVSKVLQLESSDDLQIGQEVVAIGSPLGLQNTLTEGIVSGMRQGLIQTSVPISPGSSGGPLLNMKGHVVGVAVASAIEGQNLNFAVPIAWAKSYLDSDSVSLRSLDDVSSENIVTEKILEGTVTVKGNRTLSWQIQVTSNRMSNAELRGEIESSGGLTNNITLIVFYGGQKIYNKCEKKIKCKFSMKLSQSGTYTIVLDNSGPLRSAREVSGEILFSYIQ